jgi:hypothetical protein
MGGTMFLELSRPVTSNDMGGISTTEEDHAMEKKSAIRKLANMNILIGTRDGWFHNSIESFLEENNFSSPTEEKDRLFDEHSVDEAYVGSGQETDEEQVVKQKYEIIENEEEVVEQKAGVSEQESEWSEEEKEQEYEAEAEDEKEEEDTEDDAA